MTYTQRADVLRGLVYTGANTSSKEKEILSFATFRKKKGADATYVLCTTKIFAYLGVGNCVGNCLRFTGGHDRVLLACVQSASQRRVPRGVWQQYKETPERGPERGGNV